MNATKKENSYISFQVQNLLLAQEESKRTLKDHEKKLENIATKGDLLRVGVFLFSAFFSVGGLLWYGIKTTIRNEILENNSVMQKEVEALKIHVSRLEVSGTIHRGGQ